MAESAVFSTPFFGADGKNWPFIGQIADDSTWRDNIIPYKFDEPDSIPGWGYRYKVRIMGMHPCSQEILPSEKLKFASVMYGVTDGGGQGGTFTTPAIRPGNFVFGFFMDAQENIPIIMGILGNNSQTELQSKTEMTGGKPCEGISGFAEQSGDKGEATIEAGPGSIGIHDTNETEESSILSKISGGVA